MEEEGGLMYCLIEGGGRKKKSGQESCGNKRVLSKR